MRGAGLIAAAEIRAAAINDMNAQAAAIRVAIGRLGDDAGQGLPAYRREESLCALRREQRKVISQLQQLLALTPMRPARLVPHRGQEFGAMCGDAADPLRSEITALDENGLRALLFDVAYPSGANCPRCGATQLARLTQRLSIRCTACGRHVGLRRGTVLERTHVPISTWFLLCWAMALAPNATPASLSALLNIKRQATVRRMRRQVAGLCALSVRANEHFSLRCFAQVLLAPHAAQEASSVHDEENGLA